MNIGQYTFEEFKEIARKFHGYPAPGLLIGGYMVEEAKSRLPEGILFEALVESGKCLPDAVQLLTLCSTGNNWMKVENLGRYAVSLYDKPHGEGWRVAVDPARLDAWPEIRNWFMKLKPKREQDTERLFAEIEAAGPGICSVAPVTVASKYLGHGHMSSILVCPVCREAYPGTDGAICRACQGETPYAHQGSAEAQAAPRPAGGPALTVVSTEQAVGNRALHDMTQVIPGRPRTPPSTPGRSFRRATSAACSRWAAFTSTWRASTRGTSGSMKTRPWRPLPSAWPGRA
jgi:formylmethanofuran dehydrogenase subunit E